MFKKILSIFSLLLLINSMIPQSAHAYLDPGTGSMVVQIVIASVVGFVCTFKMWFLKLFPFLKKDKNDKQ